MFLKNAVNTQNTKALDFINILFVFTKVKKGIFSTEKMSSIVGMRFLGT